MSAVYIVQNESPRLNVDAFEALASGEKIVLLVRHMGQFAIEGTELEEPIIQCDFKPEWLTALNSEERGVSQTFRGRCQFKESKTEVAVLEITPDLRFPSELEVIEEDTVEKSIW